MINLHESIGPGLIERATLDLQSDSYLQPDTLLTALRGLVNMNSGFEDVIKSK